MRPRAWDPLTNAEIDGRIREFQYSTAMDYGENFVVTDARGLAVFAGATGPQTVTAVATGFNPETFLNVNASRIGFSLDPTRLPDESGTEVDV